MDRKKLIKHLLCLIFFILIAHSLANKFYWYSSIWYFDMIMHFLGGFWIGLLFIYIFPPKDRDISSVVFKILLFILLIGIGWEVFEAFVDKTISQNPFNILDTSSDILLDFSGGAFAVLYFFKRIMLQLKDGPWENSFKDRP